MIKQFTFTVGLSILMVPHAFAGGYAEPIYAPPARPDCDRFLFWIVCDPENPSPKRERETRTGPMPRKNRPIRPRNRVILGLILNPPRNRKHRNRKRPPRNPKHRKNPDP